jgi:hypothetical protein
MSASRPVATHSVGTTSVRRGPGSVRKRERPLCPRPVRHRAGQRRRGDPLINRHQPPTVLAEGRLAACTTYVVLDARPSGPTWVTVGCRLSSAVVVQLAGTHPLDGCVQVSYTWADVSGTPRVTLPRRRGRPSYRPNSTLPTGV